MAVDVEWRQTKGTMETSLHTYKFSRFLLQGTFSQVFFDRPLKHHPAAQRVDLLWQVIPKVSAIACRNNNPHTELTEICLMTRCILGCYACNWYINQTSIIHALEILSQLLIYVQLNVEIERLVTEVVFISYTVLIKGNSCFVAYFCN